MAGGQFSGRLPRREKGLLHAIPNHLPVVRHRLPVAFRSPQCLMLDLFNTVTQHLVETSHGTGLTRLRFGHLAGSLQGPFGRSRKYQLPLCIADHRYHGKPQRGKITQACQFPSRDWPTVVAQCCQFMAQIRPMEFLSPQTLLVKVLNCLSPLCDFGLRFSEAAQEPLHGAV